MPISTGKLGTNMIWRVCSILLQISDYGRQPGAISEPGEAVECIAEGSHATVVLTYFCNTKTHFMNTISLLNAKS